MKNARIRDTQQFFVVVWYRTCSRLCSRTWRFSVDKNLIRIRGYSRLHSRNDQQQQQQQNEMKWRRRQECGRNVKKKDLSKCKGMYAKIRMVWCYEYAHSPQSLAWTRHASTLVCGIQKKKTQQPLNYFPASIYLADYIFFPLFFSCTNENCAINKRGRMRAAATTTTTTNKQKKIVWQSERDEWATIKISSVD